MTRPAVIPAFDMDAHRVWRDETFGKEIQSQAISLMARESHRFMSDYLCAAILAERQRCGKYATDQAEREPYGHCKATAYLIADNIMGAA